MTMDGAVAMLSNEAALAARAMAEPAAFAAIYDHYFLRVYNYVRYRVREADAADDIASQVFERALVNIGRYRSERAPFAVWLFAIARNAVNDHLRAQWRHRWLSLEALHDQPSDDPLPEEIAAHNETRARLLLSMACLSERERDILGLKFGAGLTNRNIGELAGLSEGNVGVIVYRAVRRLRAELSAKESDHE
jgi:RNA polymerase sigma factor (sigma-70 family)